MGGRPETPSKQTTVQEPWSAAKSLIGETLFPHAAWALSQTPRTPYQGQFYSGPTESQRDALNYGTNLARSMMAQGGPTIGRDSMNFLRGTLTQQPSFANFNQVGAPNYASAPTVNFQGTTAAPQRTQAPSTQGPAQSGNAVQERIQAEIAPLQRQFEEQIIPRYVLDLTGSGAFDNSRAAFDTSQLFRDALVAPATEAVARITYDDFARQQAELNQNWRLGAQLDQQNWMFGSEQDQANWMFANQVMQANQALAAQLGQQNWMFGSQLGQADAARLSGENLTWAQAQQDALNNMNWLRMQGAQMLPALESQQIANMFMPADILSTYGQTEQNWFQTGLNEQIAQWNEQITAPWRGLDQLAAIAYGAPGGTSTTTNSGMGGGFSGSGAITGALGGGLIGSMIPGLTALGPIGWIGAAALGGLAGSGVLG